MNFVCIGKEPIFCEVKKDWFYCACEKCEKQNKKKKRTPREKKSNINTYNTIIN